MSTTASATANAELLTTATVGHAHAKTDSIASSRKSLHGVVSTRGDATPVDYAACTPKRRSLSVVAGFPPFWATHASSPLPSVRRTSSAGPMPPQDALDPPSSLHAREQQQQQHPCPPPPPAMRGGVGPPTAGDRADSPSNAYCRACMMEVPRGSWMAHQRSEAHQRQLRACGSDWQHDEAAKPPVGGTSPVERALQPQPSQPASLLHTPPDVRAAQSKEAVRKETAGAGAAGVAAEQLHERRDQRRRFRASGDVYAASFHSDSSTTETEPSESSDDFERDGEAGSTSALAAAAVAASAPEKDSSTLVSVKQQQRQQLQQRRSFEAPPLSSQQILSAEHTSATSYNVPPLTTPRPSAGSTPLNDFLIAAPGCASFTKQSSPGCGTWGAGLQVRYVALNSKQQERRLARELEKQLRACLYQKEKRLLARCLRRWYIAMFVKATADLVEKKERRLASVHAAPSSPTRLPSAAPTLTPTAAPAVVGQEDSPSAKKGMQGKKEPVGGTPEAVGVPFTTPSRAATTSKTRHASRSRETTSSSSASGPTPLFTSQVKTYAHVHVTPDGRMQPVRVRRGDETGRGDNRISDSLSADASTESEGQELEVMHTDVRWVMKPSARTARTSSSSSSSSLFSSSSLSSASSSRNVDLAALRRTKTQLTDACQRNAASRETKNEAAKQPNARSDVGVLEEQRVSEEAPPYMSGALLPCAAEQAKGLWSAPDEHFEQVASGPGDKAASLAQGSAPWPFTPLASQQQQQQQQAPSLYSSSPTHSIAEIAFAAEASVAPKAAAKSAASPPTSVAPARSSDTPQDAEYADDDFTSDNSTALSEAAAAAAEVDSDDESPQAPPAVLYSTLRPNLPTVDTSVVDEDKGEGEEEEEKEDEPAPRDAGRNLSASKADKSEETCGSVAAPQSISRSSKELKSSTQGASAVWGSAPDAFSAVKSLGVAGSPTGLVAISSVDRETNVARRCDASIDSANTSGTEEQEGETCNDRRSMSRLITTLELAPAVGMVAAADPAQPQQAGEDVLFPSATTSPAAVVKEGMQEEIGTSAVGSSSSSSSSHQRRSSEASASDIEELAAHLSHGGVQRVNAIFSASPTSLSLSSRAAALNSAHPPFSAPNEAASSLLSSPQQRSPQRSLPRFAEPRSSSSRSQTSRSLLSYSQGAPSHQSYLSSLPARASNGQDVLSQREMPLSPSSATPSPGSVTPQRHQQPWQLQQPQYNQGDDVVAPLRHDTAVPALSTETLLSAVLGNVANNSTAASSGAASAAPRQSSVRSHRSHSSRSGGNQDQAAPPAEVIPQSDHHHNSNSDEQYHPQPRYKKSRLPKTQLALQVMRARSASTASSSSSPASQLRPAMQDYDAAEAPFVPFPAAMHDDANYYGRRGDSGAEVGIQGVEGHSLKGEEAEAAVPADATTPLSVPSSQLAGAAPITQQAPTRPCYADPQLKSSAESKVPEDGVSPSLSLPIGRTGEPEENHTASLESEASLPPPPQQQQQQQSHERGFLHYEQGGVEHSNRRKTGENTIDKTEREAQAMPAAGVSGPFVASSTNRLHESEGDRRVADVHGSAENRGASSVRAPLLFPQSDRELGKELLYPAENAQQHVRSDSSEKDSSATAPVLAASKIPGVKSQADHASEAAGPHTDTADASPAPPPASFHFTTHTTEEGEEDGAPRLPTDASTPASSALPHDGASLASAPDSRPWGSAAAASWQQPSLLVRTPALPFSPSDSSEQDAVPHHFATWRQHHHRHHHRRPSRTPRLSDIETTTTTTVVTTCASSSASSVLPAEPYSSLRGEGQEGSAAMEEEGKGAKTATAREQQEAAAAPASSSSTLRKAARETTQRRQPSCDDRRTSAPHGAARRGLPEKSDRSVRPTASRSPRGVMPTTHPYCYMDFPLNAGGAEKRLMAERASALSRTASLSSSSSLMLDLSMAQAAKTASGAAAAKLTDLVNSAQTLSATSHATPRSFSLTASSPAVVAAPRGAAHRHEDRAFSRAHVRHELRDAPAEVSTSALSSSAARPERRRADSHHRRHSSRRRHRRHPSSQRRRNQPHEDPHQPVRSTDVLFGFEERSKELHAAREEGDDDAGEGRRSHAPPAAPHNAAKEARQEGEEKSAREEHRRRHRRPSRHSSAHASDSADVSQRRHLRHRRHPRRGEEDPLSLLSDRHGSEEDVDDDGAPTHPKHRVSRGGHSRIARFWAESERYKAALRGHCVDLRDPRYVMQDSRLSPTVAGLHAEPCYRFTHPYEWLNRSRLVLSAPRTKDQIANVRGTAQAGVLRKGGSTVDLQWPLKGLAKGGSAALTFGRDARLHARVHHHRHGHHLSSPLSRSSSTSSSSSSSSSSLMKRSETTNDGSRDKNRRHDPDSSTSPNRDSGEGEGGVRLMEAKGKRHSKHGNDRSSSRSSARKRQPLRSEVDDQLDGKEQVTLPLYESTQYEHGDDVRSQPPCDDEGSPTEAVANPLAHKTLALGSQQKQQTPYTEKQRRNDSDGSSGMKRPNLSVASRVKAADTPVANKQEGKQREKERVEDSQQPKRQHRHHHHRHHDHDHDHHHRHQRRSSAPMPASPRSGENAPLLCNDGAAGAAYNGPLIVPGAHDLEKKATPRNDAVVVVDACEPPLPPPPQQQQQQAVAAPSSSNSIALVDPHHKEDEGRRQARRGSRHLAIDDTRPAHGDEYAEGEGVARLDPTYRHGVRDVSARNRRLPPQDAEIDAPTAAQPGDLFYKDDDGVYHRIRDDAELRSHLAQTTAPPSAAGSRRPPRPLYVVHLPRCSPSPVARPRSRSPTTRVLPRRVWTITDPKSPLGCSRLNPYCATCRRKYHLIFVDANLRPLRWPSPQSAELASMGDCRIHSGYVFGGDCADCPREASLTAQRARALFSRAWPALPHVRADQLLVQEADVDRPLRQLTPPPRGRFIPVSYDTHGAAELPPPTASRPSASHRSDEAAANATYCTGFASAAVAKDARSSSSSRSAGAEGDLDAAAMTSERATALRNEERRIKKALKRLLWRDLPQQRGTPEWDRYLHSLSKKLRQRQLL